MVLTHFFEILNRKSMEYHTMEVEIPGRSSAHVLVLYLNGEEYFLTDSERIPDEMVRQVLEKSE